MKTKKPVLKITGERQCKDGFVRERVYSVTVAGSIDGRTIVKRELKERFPKPASSGPFAYYNPKKKTLETKSGGVILSEAQLTS